MRDFASFPGNRLTMAWQVWKTENFQHFQISRSTPHVSETFLEMSKGKSRDTA